MTTASGLGTADTRWSDHETAVASNRLPRTIPRRRFGSAGRLAALHGALLALVLGIVGITIVRDFSSHFEAVAGKSLVQELNSFAAVASRRPANSDLLVFAERYLRSHPLAAGVDMAIVIPGRGVVGSAGSRSLVKSKVVNDAKKSAPGATALSGATIGSRSVELLAAPIRVDGATVGTFVATYDLAALDAERTKVMDLALAEGAIVLAAGVASAYLLLRRLLRTVGRITDAAMEIEQGDLDLRLGDQGTHDEVGHLVSSFDSMIDRISRAMNSQRRLLADISHQLRTPLTVARGHLEVLRRTELRANSSAAESVDVVLDELDHMNHLVERLLILGRAMEPDFLAREQVDLESFMTELFDSVSVLAPRRWLLALPPACWINADSGKLRGALLNLVDNAVKATDEFDAIEISATLTPEGDVALTVEDSGPGIPPAQREAVLERYARPGARLQGGSGLGLAIAKAVAEAHGGRIEIGESRHGGCRVGLVLPASLVPVRREEPSACSS